MGKHSGVNVDLSAGPAVVEDLGKFAEMSLGMLPQMLWREGADRGLFSFKLRRNANGSLENVGTSLRYTLIAWIGLLSALPEPTRNSVNWRTGREKLATLLTGTQRFSLGELGLMLWLSELDPNVAWRQAVLERIPGLWRQAWRGADTLEMGMLLKGLVEAGQHGSFTAEVTRRILDTFNPQIRLFGFQKYTGARFFRASGYRQVFGSFASQVYSLVALAGLQERCPSDELATVIESAASRICQLQGPDGEWWWIYDLRTGEVLVDYPVYSIHQDGMGPMALVAAMRALKTSTWMPFVGRGLQYLTTYREPRTGDGFLEDGCIWRAVIRNHPDEDPADKPFGLTTREMQWVTQQGRPAWLRSAGAPEADGFRMLKEARAYCPGWILYAYAEACRLHNKPCGLTSTL